MDVRIDIRFEEGIIKISELERKIKFLRELPIKVKIDTKGKKILKVRFSENQCVYICPEKGSATYERLDQIKDCNVDANSDFIMVYEIKSTVSYNFFYNSK